MQNDTLLDPAFFLASLTKVWLPRVVVVRRGSEVKGIVYAKERAIAGRRLGVVYADLTFGSILLGNSRDCCDTFLFALRSLFDFPGVRGVRLRLRRSTPEVAAVRRLLSASLIDAQFSRTKEHAVLSLPSTYQQLLGRFGSVTRRNFRYYRNRCEAEGHVFIENLSLEDLRSAVASLGAKVIGQCRPEDVEKCVNMTAAARRPLAVGLRHRNGEWLSVISGAYRGDSAVMLFQLNNDREFPRYSLSTVLRGYLIEYLIQQGTKEFIIWGGTSPPLSRYVEYLPTVGVYLDKPTSTWRLTRRLVSNLGLYLPRSLHKDARWIARF